MAKKSTAECPARLGRVGGGALIEGVMMRSGENVAVVCRREDGSLRLVREKYVSLRKRHPWLNIPILRGVINFIEMLVLSMHTLNLSAKVYGGEIEEGRFERWCKKHLGVDLYGIVTFIAGVLGVFLAVALYIYLPKLISGWIGAAVGGMPLWLEGVLEGGMKLLIFILYIWAVSLIPDIRRTFQYHGAEHKSIACFEAGAPLTPGNAKGCSRFHPRCGTSFMFVMILLGILLGIALRYILPAEIRSIHWLYTLIRLLLIPLIVGVGFEFIMYAGKHSGPIVRLLSAPGLWMQRLTTREPDEGMLEVAILSLKSALPEEFPEFDPTIYEEKEEKLPTGNGASDTTEPAPEMDGAATVTPVEKSEAETEVAARAEDDPAFGTHGAASGTGA